MNFNSFDFFFFFLATAAAYFLSPLRLRWLVIIAASAIFYAWPKPVYIVLPTLTILSTWYGAQLIDRSSTMDKRRRLMRLTLLANLAILVLFKYLGFFNEMLDLFSRVAKGAAHFRLHEFAWPIGISFYTFQSIGYVLDVYYKVRKPEQHLGYYAAFVSFFPQILSGPIGRSTELLPQMSALPKAGWADVENGIGRFGWGLFKKLVIADRIGLIVDDVYADPGRHFGATFWFITVLYALQLYADFSGYTDMAIGVARIMGVRLAENFDYPYISRNVTEFWRRWHLSLSNWLRDYLYTPIMFSKKRWKKKAVVFAIFLTFLICGLWHGAKFTFVIFGLLQGAALTWEMISSDWRKKWQKAIPGFLYNSMSWFLTFLFIVFCFIFFRAQTTKDALLIAKREFTSLNLHDFISFLGTENTSRILFSLGLCFLFFAFDKPLSTLFRGEDPAKSTRRAIVLGILLAMTLALGVMGRADFIYFRF